MLYSCGVPSLCPHPPQGCRTLWYRFLALIHAAQPWHYALKQISGRFGSSVLSYFLFLKTLLLFNIISFLLLLVFVVALQAAYPPAVASPRPFTGLELLTGAVSATVSVPCCLGAAPSLIPAPCPCISCHGGALVCALVPSAAPAQGTVPCRLMLTPYQAGRVLLAPARSLQVLLCISHRAPSLTHCCTTATTATPP